LDAVALLGFGSQNTEALPAANPGETIIRYGGWSLQELRGNAVAAPLMHFQNWYDRYAWGSEKLPSGIYILRLPVPGSSRKSFKAQTRLLLPGEEPGPVVLAASALIAHRLSGGKNTLKNGWTRCKERTDAGRGVELIWVVGRLFVFNCLIGDACTGVWLASARKAS
jgi:hypothetical protein